MPDRIRHRRGSSDDLSPSLGGSKHAGASGDEPRLGGEAALAHLFEALDDPDLAVRERAANALGELGSEQAITRLLALLHDPQADLRAQAARALGRARSIEAVGALLEALRDDSDKVRWSAAEALGRIGHEGAVTDLLAALRDRDQVVRERAAEALGVIGESLPSGPLRDSIPPALLQTLRVTSPIFYPRLSQIISRSLLQMRDAAVPALIDTLRQDEGRLSETAAEILAFHCLAAADPVLRARIAAALIRASNSREPFIARASIRALGTAAPSLVIDRDDVRLAHWAIRKLMNQFTSAGAPGEPVLVALRAISRQTLAAAVLPRDAGYVRPDLVQTLGRLGAEHKSLAVMVIPRLIEALYDDDHALRRAGVEALARLAEHQPDAVHPAIPALASRLSDDTGRPFSREPRISDAAAAVLGRLATPEALRALELAGRSVSE